MKKSDLKRYVEAFDVEEDKLCYCWGCLDKDPSRDVRALLYKVMEKLGDDLEPDYVIMTLIKSVFGTLRKLSDKDFIAWAKGNPLTAHEFIACGLRSKDVISNSVIVDWMESPYANGYLIKSRFIIRGETLFDKIIAGYLLWSHEIQIVIKQHILSTLKEGCACRHD